MEKYKLNKNDIKIHNIIYAYTSSPDYEMERYLLLENMPNCKYDEYVVVEGYHCSCYGFDDTEWEAMKYTEEELIKLAKVKKKYSSTENNLWNYIDEVLFKGGK